MRDCLCEDGERAGRPLAHAGPPGAHRSLGLADSLGEGDEGKGKEGGDDREGENGEVEEEVM